jgi:hypothetical protein
MAAEVRSGALMAMPSLPARRVRFGHWLRGRCSRCGARDWAAYYDGYTIPEPVCRRFGFRPESEGGSKLRHHLVVLALITITALAVVIAFFVCNLHQ